jgi:hypothetical protein
MVSGLDSAVLVLKAHLQIFLLFFYYFWSGQSICLDQHMGKHATWMALVYFAYSEKQALMYFITLSMPGVGWLLPGEV